MRKHTGMLAAAVLALTVTADPAAATILTFSGSWTDVGVAGPDPGCAPLPFGGSASGSGSSTLGAFSYSHDICFSPFIPAEPNFVGTFTLDFGTYSLFGTMSGSDSPDAIPGVFDITWNYVVQGGTGEFLNAFGGFTAIGTSDSRTRPTQQSLVFAGLIDAPAVPEPRTWELLLLGFGLTGGVLRRHRRLSPIQQLA